MFSSQRNDNAWDDEYVNYTIWSLYNVYIYQKSTLYPINMYNNFVSIKTFLKTPTTQQQKDKQPNLKISKGLE